MKKFLASAATAFLIAAGGIAVTANAANATSPITECVPSEAYTEIVPDIEHPAVGTPTIVVSNPDYKPATEGTPAVWANFSPNDSQGTFVGPPVYPVDDRGTWNDHGQLPPGQAGPDGVYANGNPDKGGNWFYRQAAVPGTPAVGTPTIEVTNPDYKPAYTEVIPDIEHPAVICEEPPVVVNECTTGTSTNSTNLNNLWSNVDTRSAGHYEYVDGGLHVWTDDNSSQAKVSLGQAISFKLKNTGVLDLDWTGSTPPPGINLFVNFGADGNGTLVYESVYGQDLWLTNGSSAAVKANAPVNGGGNGSQWHGAIDQWLTKYPDATVTGIAFSLGSGVLGDGVISSITAGCGTHTFDYVEPAAQPEPQSETRTLTDVDCDTKIVTETAQERHTLEPTYDSSTNTWSEPEWTDWATTGTTERAATADECKVTPTPTPTPTETTKPTPSNTSTPAPVVPVSGTLATTGGDVNWVFPALLVGGVIVAGGTWLIVMAYRRRPEDTNSVE